MNKWRISRNNRGVPQETCYKKEKNKYGYSRGDYIFFQITNWNSGPSMKILLLEWSFGTLKHYWAACRFYPCNNPALKLLFVTWFEILSIAWFEILSIWFGNSNTHKQPELVLSSLLYTHPLNIYQRHRKKNVPYPKGAKKK